VALQHRLDTQSVLHGESCCLSQTTGRRVDAGLSSEARRYQGEGVLCVEMEAAALFAVAEVSGLQVASAFAISDSLADLPAGLSDGSFLIARDRAVKSA
jgi:nucleoside phosphorylase